MPADDQRLTVMDEVSRGAPRRRSHLPDRAVQAIGLSLFAAICVLIIGGHYVMSHTAATALQILAVISGAGYGIYLAAHSRTTQMNLERAYSAHLEELSQRLRNMAYRDAVTGLYNHRYFREQLAHEVERALRYGQPLSLLLMDMDNFKTLNDKYGHFMGDRFLGMVGELIERQIRSSDIGARYGGDEFVVVLPNTMFDEARLTAEKLAAGVASAAAMTTTGEVVQLGLSIGVATCPDDARTAGDLIEQADARLYDVKATRKSGRRHTGAA